MHEKQGFKNPLRVLKKSRKGHQHKHKGWFLFWLNYRMCFSFGRFGL